MPDKNDQEDVTKLLNETHQCVPVWLNKEMMDLSYNGFCNGVLWQLFHYVPVQGDFKLSETRTLEQQWNAYVDANALFAEATLNDYRCHNPLPPYLPWCLH